MKLRDEPFLSCYLDVTDRISEYEGKIARMQDVAYDPPDGMPEVKKEKPHGDGKKPIVDDKVDLEKAREHLLMERGRVRKVIVSAINSVGDERLERMLYSYYIQGKPIKEIASDTGIGYSHTNTLLHRGVERIRSGKDETNQ